MPTTLPKEIKKIHIIINPASGRIEPILPVINAVMTEAKLNWEVFVTKKPHDAASFAKDAVAAGVDAVAIYGGDGTVMEVVRGMMGSDIPLAILPGGTANVLATELKIPKELKGACELIASQTFDVRTIDVGRLNKQHFILRVGLGFEADMMKGADRDIKNRFGRLAYVISTAKALTQLKEVKYHLEIDGKEYDSKGITCIVANSGNIGFGDLSLNNNIDVSDGLLDVVIVRHVNIGLFAHSVAVLLCKERKNNVEVVHHWQGKDIKVTSTPKQIVQCDGEVLEKVPVHVKIVPGAIRIIVPLPEGKDTPSSPDRKKN